MDIIGPRITNINNYAYLIECALKELTPDAKYSLVGAGTAFTDVTINWLDTVITEPTTVAIEASIVGIQSNYADNLYLYNRKDNFPPLEDFAYAYWSQVSVGDSGPMNEYLAAADAVAVLYPSP